MKRVLFVYGGAKNRGGIYTYLLELFLGLKNERGLSLELSSVSNWPLIDKVEGLGYPTWTVKKTIGGIISGLKKTNDYDLIVTMGMVSNIFGRIWGSYNRVPVYTVVHSDWHTDYKGFRLFLFWVTDRMLRTATKKYICVSEYLKNITIADGISSDRIRVIHNGVRWSPPEKKKQKSSSQFIIGSVGRLHPVKNYQSLIETFSRLANKNIKLQIVGEGTERKKLEESINNLRLEDYVELMGQRKDIPRILSGWDLYVQPSLSEGFGLATVEAMLSGLPVVVTPGGSLPEIIRDGETGIIAKGFKPSDLVAPIEELLKDSELREKISVSGQKYAQKEFSVETWISKMKNILEEGN